MCPQNLRVIFHCAPLMKNPRGERGMNIPFTRKKLYSLIDENLSFPFALSVLR